MSYGACKDIPGRVRASFGTLRPDPRGMFDTSPPPPTPVERLVQYRVSVFGRHLLEEISRAEFLELYITLILQTRHHTLVAEDKQGGEKTSPGR